MLCDRTSSLARGAGLSPSEIAPHTPSLSRCPFFEPQIGMTQLWDTWGVLTPVTVLHCDRNRITQYKTTPLNDYAAVQVGAGGVKRKNETKSALGRISRMYDRDTWRDLGAGGTLDEYDMELWEDGYGERQRETGGEGSRVRRHHIVKFSLSFLLVVFLFIVSLRHQVIALDYC